MTIDSSLLLWQENALGRVESALETCFADIDVSAVRLHEAMRYAAMGGGKRIRPLLVYATASLGGYSLDEIPGVDACAVAIELFHTYSLVHDDLPAMDNDDLRRGRATVHKAYDEATGLLVGDALQTMAFRLIAESTLSDHQKVEVIKSLSVSGGLEGMAGGQAIDLESVGKPLTREQLELMHSLKTGALLRSCVKVGAILANLDAKQSAQLDKFAQYLGLAFQVVDDVLDASADTKTLGKTAGKDAAADKPTFVSLMNLEGAREFARKLHQDAIDSLGVWDENANLLRALANKVLYRQN